MLLYQQACIESKDPVVQALGFQSLAYLCEADVIGNLDFTVNLFALDVCFSCIYFYINELRLLIL